MTEIARLDVAEYEAEDGIDPALLDIHEFSNHTTNERETLRLLKRNGADRFSNNYWNLTYEANGQFYLRSDRIFIGDTDDVNFNWEEAIKALPEYKFRVYRTFKGFRFFILNTFINLTSSNSTNINKIVGIWKCDPLYIKYLWCFFNYSARLLPKTSRLENEDYVTSLIYSDELASDSDNDWRVDTVIRDFIRIHDMFTLEQL